MHTGSNPRDRFRDEPIAATPGVRGETGLALPAAECRTTPTPSRGRPPGVINAADAIKKGGRRRSLSFPTGLPTSRDLVPVLRRQLPSVGG